MNETKAKEATTLQKKKNSISKGKLKKTIKNVLCRPDPVFWPEVTEDEGQRLESALKKHKIAVPEFKKPHWKELKLIPKEKRPKPPKLKKVEGLLLGIRECTDAVQTGECSAIIIEAKVNPRMIVQPILELCTTKDVTVLCLSDLRKITAANFGTPTSCLGIKRNTLLDTKKEILEIAKNHPRPEQSNEQKKLNNSIEEKMDIENVETREESNVCDGTTTFQFLYRTSKKNRVFVPTALENVSSKPTRRFIGQDFIEFSDKPDLKNSKAFMRMLVKKFANNPDRVKKK
ncbi:hypothetical protein PYW07_005266 [Mythimna separata]|uniref:Ribosomal protein L7Ae/L30e/S12e/Gadd45 domain-containing protein n=1 Tax=Mythimna separata TaxID=271217 RepID=A0AAD7YE16_MYTSE|nr:hypothetical protein PYW07_005266 [Mythimna separata]